MKTHEGEHAEGWNDGISGRPINNTYGDTPQGCEYVEGYEEGKLRRERGPINDPGARDNADGSVTVQMAKRSEQLQGIADDITAAFANYGRESESDDIVEAGSVVLPPSEVHRLRGYMETLGIISDELYAAGK